MAVGILPAAIHTYVISSQKYRCRHGEVQIYYFDTDRLLHLKYLRSTPPYDTIKEKGLILWLIVPNAI